MPPSHFILLYVDQPAESARFYERVLDRKPLELSPTFAMFALREGLMLGLWSKHTVDPATDAAPGAGEIAFTAPDAKAVDATCARWQAAGVRIAQPPCRLDFGYTALGLDPDGHRLRVFTPG